MSWILAHGIGGIRDLPVPRYVFYYGAAAVLVVSFAALGPDVFSERPVRQKDRPGSP